MTHHTRIRFIYLKIYKLKGTKKPLTTGDLIAFQVYYFFSLTIDDICGLNFDQ